MSTFKYSTVVCVLTGLLLSFNHFLNAVFCLPVNCIKPKPPPPPFSSFKGSRSDVSEINCDSKAAFNLSFLPNTLSIDSAASIPFGEDNTSDLIISLIVLTVLLNNFFKGLEVVGVILETPSGTVVSVGSLGLTSLGFISLT